jgi:thiol-disulfide isomerase/thioredoxin
MKREKILNFLLLIFILSACAPTKVNFGETDEAVNDPITWTECSQNIGDHPCNFTLKDQNDNDISLYDMYGSVIVLDMSAMWCGPCQQAGSDVQETINRFPDTNIEYITVLIENLQGEAPSLDDVNNWATVLGIITEPVLQGSRSFLNSDPAVGWPLQSWPTFAFITRDMKIYEILKGYNQQNIDYLIEQTAKEGEDTL